MLVSFDTKFIRRDQKRHRNGEACQSQSDVFLGEPNKLDIKRHLCGFVFIMHY